jgi:hypothetical protein
VAIANYLATVTLDDLTAFSGETVVNNFAFVASAPLDATGLALIDSALIEFYNAVGAGGTYPISHYLASELDRTTDASRIKIYDVTGKLGNTVAGKGGKMHPASHGSPVHEWGFALGAAGSTNSYPAQIAACMTLRGRGALGQPIEGPGGVRPRARHSGRLYLGPFCTAVAAGTNPQRIDSANFITDALAAAEKLQDDLSDGALEWAVWSRAEAQMFPVTRVEMDNSFDVIRSRKSTSTTRAVRTFTPEPALVLGA